MFQSKPTERHLTQLDALRGLAALVVFIHHCVLMTPRPSAIVEALSNTPVGVLWDGPAAVLLFFVLSGFVLNLRYAESRKYPGGWWKEFLIKRVLRIYPAYMFVIALAICLRHSVGSTLLFSPWFAHVWSAPPSIAQAIRTFSLISPKINRLTWDPPIWSLVVEMRVSLIFPLVILAVNGRRAAWFDATFMAAAYLVCLPLYANSAPDICLYFPNFLLGAFVAKYFSEIRIFYLTFRTFGKALLLIVGLLFFELFGIARNANLVEPMPYFVVHQLCGIGAALLIISCAFSSRIKSIFDRPVLQFMGRTSYSFYLIHLVVLLSIAAAIHSIDGGLSWPIWIVGAVLSYVASGLIYHYIEAPFIDLGKRWARRQSSKHPS
jgi:peptidoglycan/LPS O-acetylase OafA/YrhL